MHVTELTDEEQPFPSVELQLDEQLLVEHVGPVHVIEAVTDTPTLLHGL